jgi:hypothetical protein
VSRQQPKVRSGDNHTAPRPQAPHCGLMANNKFSCVGLRLTTLSISQDRHGGDLYQCILT